MFNKPSLDCLPWASKIIFNGIPTHGYFVVGMGAWFALLAVVGFVRERHALIGAFDTGIYLQLISNLATSGSLESSVTGEVNFLAHHFQPIIFLLTPLAPFATHPMSLLLVSLLSLVILANVLCQITLELPSSIRALGFAALFGMMAHPAISGRVWYGFSPDVIALPGFALMVRGLLNPYRTRPWEMMLAALWASACKETFWLTSAATLYVFFDARKEKKNAFFWSILALCLFVFVFFVWMPGHSQLPRYYGLTYYFQTPGNEQTAFGMILEIIGNLTSQRTFTTIITLALATSLIPFLSWSRPWIGAIPGLLIITTSHSDIVHHPANHYLLAVLPFAFGASISWLRERVPQMGIMEYPLMRRGLFYSLIFVPLAMTLLHSGGLVDQLALIKRHPQTAYWRGDTLALKKLIPTKASLLVDSNLQPLFSDHPDTTILLSSVGNPKRLDPQVLKNEFFIVTTEDIKGLSSCTDVAIGGIGMHVDIKYFQMICERVKFNGQEIAYFSASGIRAYHLPKMES